MNIVLVGYRGTGKSTVGRLLAERLGMRYLCMDAEIIQKVHMDISEFVAQYGWEKFRDIESELTRELTGLDDLIIDTGGGVIERQENIGNLRVNAQVFWLRASVETTISRIKDCTARPALTAGKTFLEEVAEVLAVREPKYKAASHYEIDANGTRPGEIADTIASIWESLPIEVRTQRVGPA